MKEFEPGRGFTREDWDAVSDNPEWTPEDFGKAKPFVEVFPKLAASVKRVSGRPLGAEPKEAVTPRLSPATVAKFRAMGGDWRAQMAKRLEGCGAGFQNEPRAMRSPITV